MLKKLVAMWRCLLNGRYTRNAATSAMCAHHRTRNAGLDGLGSSMPVMPGRYARAEAMNAPGWSPKRAISKTWANSSVATTPPIIAEDHERVAVVGQARRAA